MAARKLEGLEQLLAEELQDTYDAEKQLVRALPKMAKAAADEELEKALREHLEVTKGQVQRIEQIFESMEMRARSRPCKGMKGIVEEGQEMLEQEHEERLLDPAIVGAARKVEHYEMASYASLRALAQQLGRRGVAQLIDETLREEMQADKQLAQISKRLLKQASSRGSGEPERQRPASRSSRAEGSSHPSKTSGRTSSQRTRGHASHALTDEEEIRKWAEERGAHPACVRGTGNKDDIGMIRLDFPGYTGADSLEPISWENWFEKFNERQLALMVQDTTAGGQPSNFNKLVSRKTAAAAQKSGTRSAG